LEKRINTAQVFVKKYFNPLQFFTNSTVFNPFLSSLKLLFVRE